MTIVELLQVLRRNNVAVSIEQGKLRTVAPKGAIDADLAALIRQHKDELLAFLERAGEQGDEASQRVRKAPAAAAYPLSFAQQRLWFIDQLQGHSRQYNMPTALRLSGRLDEHALQQALDALVERHESLRTCFLDIDGTPMQRVQALATVPLLRADLSDLDEAARQTRLQQMAALEAAQPFDLSRDLMLRCSLIRLGQDEHALLFTLHHIASDGWSLGVLVREIGALYTAFCQGQANPLAPLEVQYADYASWQRQRLQGDTLQRQLGFWREHLDGAPGLIELPTDRARPAVQSYAGNYVPVRLSRETSQGLRRLSQRHGTTLFMTLLAGWSVLLARLSGQDDVVVGTPVANRQRAEIEPLIGFFANTLALRVKLDANPSVSELLAQVRQSMLQALSCQDLPFEQVVETLQPARSLSHSPVFQVMLALNNTPGGGELGLPGLSLAPLRVAHASTHFDLVLALNEAEEEIRGGLEYASDLFDHATLERWVGHLAVLLQAMAEDDACTVQDLPLLDAAGRERVVQEFNATTTAYSRDALVHELVEAQVPLSPDAAAVIFDGESLSYAELNARANRLAHYLRAQGVGPDSRVVISMQRSLEMAVAVLGTLKAGAAYVPLDPAYPADRRAYMLEDSAPLLVLSQTALLGEFTGTPVPVLALDVETFADQPHSDPPRVPGSDAANLGYVIYTSGSTGRPKGVCLPHRALVNLMQWHMGELAPTARCLQFASLSFDASFHELWAAWLCGGAVVIPPEDVRSDSVALAQFLQQHRIDKVILPVVMLQHLAEQHGEAPQALAALREVMATGEQLKITPAVRRLFENLPQARLHNHYGPSETHVVTAEILGGAPAQWPTFPSIGRPIANSQIHILDRQRRPQPVGVFGEVFIGGDNLARSYLNRPELTAERFVPDVVGADPEQRLYKTGDVGRWLADGRIEYVGRNDHQVKIRGFRVEPGEIESVLSAHAQVREAVVVARDDKLGGRRLVAYLTHPEGVQADAEALREYLRANLPEYMVPSQFVSLAQLPLSANRKIDRSALPEPEAATAVQVAPQTATEQRLATIWQRILKQDSVGRHANFFELGGHSLLATRVVSEVARTFGKPVAVRALFEHPTLAGLAAHIDAQLASGYAAIPRCEREGLLPLSFAQQRLWILDNVDKAAGALYRIPAALRLNGELDRAALQSALDRIVARHESLRTVFVEIDGVPQQRILAADSGFALDLHDLRDLRGNAQAAAVARLSAEEIGAPFDLQQGPLVRGRLLQLAQTEHVLLLTQHHIVSDGWSLSVLVKEVSALYTAYSQGLDDPLPPLSVQYADFAAWQRQRLQGETLQKHLDYWRTQLSGLPAVHNLPLDRPRPLQQRYEGGRAQLDVDAATLAGLHALARRHDASLFMLLQAAFALLISRWSGEDDIVMGTPIAGRLHPDVEPLIGFFVNTLVLRTDLSANPSFDALLARARTTALAAYEHQEIPFEMLVDELKPVRSLSHTPLFQLMFTLQNNEQESLQLPGLSLAAAASRNEQSKFDLQLMALESGGGLRLSWIYAQSLFEPASIARLSAAFGRLLQAIVAAPQQPVAQLALLDDADRAQLAQWNDTAAAFDERCFHQLFEQQAQRSPQAIAIRYGGDTLSYAQLDRRANQLAQRLREHGVGPDSVVALCLERSLHLGGAILGVMKAGGAYLPLDPASPDDHLRYILEDSGAALVLSQGALASRLQALGATVLSLDDAALWDGPDAPSSVPQLRNTHLAYSIYTSGSSGRPKGVLVEHRSLANLAANLSRNGIADGAIHGCWALAASYAFDGSIKALVQWASGGEVLVVPETTKVDPLALRTLLREQRVDFMDCTPSLLQSWLAAGLGDCLPNLVIGGEAISADLWAQLIDWQAASGRLAINVYGPTECCVDTTWARVAGSQPVIGRNLANVSCHVLSPAGEPTPIGVPGELYIGGAGVARGYRNQPALDASKFVANPFGEGRLYRSGDRVRRRDDGALEFLGRLDEQVKLRGFRIEPGEVENALRRSESVRDALVLVRGEGSEARLVAYVVAEAQAALLPALKAQLAAQLPAYLQPSAYVVLPRLPLTVNGKVDKAALPLPEAAAAQAYIAPGSETEAQLAAIWQQVLRRERIGIHDNFFEIGGDSILAIQVTSRANQAGIAITTRQLFEAQTIAALAQCAQPQRAVEHPQGEITGALTLLPIQQQFLSSDAADKHHHNQAVLLQVPAQLSAAALRTAVAALYRRHDALRLRFREQGGQWQAAHAAFDDAMLEASCVVERLPDEADAIAGYLSDRCNHWQAGFELADGPLLRVVLFQGAEQSRLLLLAHHLVIDGVSWRILLADLETAYRQLERGEAVVLAPKTSSLQQWGEALAAHAQSPQLAQEKAYWLAQYRLPVPPLPVDHATTDGGEMAQAAHVGLRLDAEDTRALLQQCNRAYRTQINELLLAGVYLGLRRWSGEKGLRIALEGHGREALSDTLDLTQTLGWFTSIYPLTLWHEQASVEAVIKGTKEQYRAVPERGIGYGVLRHLAQDAQLIEAEAGQWPELAFNYLGQSEQAVNEDTFFQGSSESAGASQSPRRRRAHALVLKGMVAGGELRLSLEYGRERYERASMETLAAQIETALREIVEHCATRERAAFTPSDFPLAQVDQAQLDQWQQQYPALTRLYPATPMQAGLMFESLLGVSSYLIQTYPVLRGELDAQAFRRAWQQVVDRHDIFRTAFVGEGEGLHQLVSVRAELPWHEEDWSALDAAEQERRFEAYRAQDKQTAFDFAAAPLMRVALFHLGGDRYQLLWTMHHILLDGWCIPLVYRDVMRLLQAQVQGRDAGLPAAPPFEAHIAWLQRQDREAARAHWHNVLGAIDAPTALAVDRLASDGGEGYREQFLELTPAQTEALQAAAQSQRSTVNTLVQWAWAYLLHRYSGDTEVVFGATISGRPAEVPGVEEMVGLFINTIPVRVSFAPESGIAASLAALQLEFQRSSDYGYLSLPEIQRQSRVRAGTPLFDSLLAFANYPLDAMTDAAASPGAKRLEIERAGHDDQTNYKLSLNANLDRVLRARLAYRAEHFGAATIERLLGHLGRILAQLPAAIAAGGGITDLLTEAETQQLRAWGEPVREPTPELCIHELFQAQAARTPQALAAVFGDDTLSYAELNAQANRVAHYLLAQGVQRDSLVGLCVERSTDMLVGMLGILKAGAAYLPLDPDYPEERIAYMLEDSSVEHVLTQSAILEALPLLGEKTVLPLDPPLRAAFLAAQPEHDPDRHALGLGPRNLAYAIYTSGSTGQPKGALIEHRNVVRLVNAANYVQLNPGAVMAQASNSAFDAATFEIWGALANGMSLFHIDKETLLDPLKLSRALEHGRVDTLFITTAVFNQMSIVDASGFARLEHLLFGGEGVDMEAVNRVLQAGKPRRLLHVYGPTENTTFSTWFEITQQRADTYPIGRPIAGTTQYVLDAQRRLVPCGVTGELYLGGDGVGRGYLGQPALTAERFVADPFGSAPDARLYRSGDLVRWLPEGEIQFVGRVDDQIKIRGFRIELGEIETQLRGHDSVQETVVVARREDGTTRLVAYVVCVPQAEELPNEVLLAKDWRAHLKQRLPDYMLPAAFVVMDSLPLNSNGKVDKRRLPAPDYQAQQQYVAPQSEIELKLAEIWCQLLRIDQVGVHDNFFEMGGDSILLIQVVSRANQAGIAITTKHLFEAQTIAEVAKLASSEGGIVAPQEAVCGELPLLPIHHLFLGGDACDRHHFNQSVLLQTPAGFDPAALRAMVAAIYRRHDALRLRFVEEQGQWRATHAPLDADMLANSVVVETLPADAAAQRGFIVTRCNHWQASFDLAQGPLLRAVYFEPAEAGGNGRLLLSVHHIVVDGVSWRVLLADLEQAYEQHRNGETVALRAKTSSLQQWGAALVDYAHSAALQQEKAYWLAQSGADVPPLPVDREIEGQGAISTSRTLPLSLDADTTRALLQQCPRVYRTQVNELLLAGVYLGMREWTSAAGLRLRLEGHGREALFEQLDITQTVGWFTSVYPLTLHSAGSEVGEVIKAIKEQYRAVPNHGIGYGMLRYLARDAELGAVAAAVDESGLEFNYLGQFDQVINADTRFQAASEGSGAQASNRRQRSARLALSGKVFGGQMQFALSYSTSQYDEATMRSLAALLEAGMRRVVEHCLQPGAGGFTPSDFPLAKVEQTQLDAWQRRYPTLAKLYPATPMQAGLLFESLLDRSAYIVQTFPVLRGGLDVAAFRQAWQQAVDRHDVFRTAFVESGELHQLVLSQATLPWHEEDWSGLSAQEQEHRFAVYRAQDRQAGFDFARPPLIRLALFRLGNDRYQLLWTLHHVLLDGWCVPLVYRDVMRFYQAQLEGRSADLPPPPSYEQHIAWLQRQDAEAARTHWRTLLAGIDAPTALVVDRLPSDGESGRRDESVELTAEQTLALQATAQSQHTTVNTLVQWAWAYLLHRYSGETDVVFGATISGRPAAVPGIEEMVGLFINAIPVRVCFDGSRSIAAAIAQLHQEFQRSNDYAYLSLPEIQRQSRVRSGTPLFDSLMEFGNYPLDAMADVNASPAASDLQLERRGHDEASNYKLGLNVSFGRTLKVKIGYRAEHFAQGTLQRLLGHLARVLAQLPAAVANGSAIGSLLGEAELAQLRYWSALPPQPLPELCAHQLFEAHARRDAQATAVVCAGESLSYGELNARANRVARHLLAQGVRPDDLVGLCVERSVDMLVGVLGILKAGAAYLPLDPEYPEDRIAYMLEDSGIEHVLVHSAVLEALPLLGEKTVLPLDGAMGEALLGGYDDGDIDSAATAVTPSNLAYAIYTSGSTGKPKGVLLEHRGLVNLALNQQRLHGLSARSRVLAFASLSFDAATWEWVMALASGASLHICQQDERLSAQRLSTFLREQRITHATLPPALLAQMDATADYALQVLVVAGEACEEGLAWTWAQRCRVCNAYGPTETTVCATQSDVLAGQRISLGRALANFEVLVLDAQLQPQPVGLPGELFIGGTGLARGYLNQPQLTAERFIAHPQRPGERLYRSGDLVRWLPEGELQFLGRVDSQVKIRGFRVELGEIEARLSACEDVRQAVVVAREDVPGSKRLVAYVVAAAAHDALPNEVLLAKRWTQQLRQQLPDYMVPVAYVLVEQIPLTGNGKLDLRRLPTPDYQGQQDYVAPQTATEQTLVTTWRELLALDALGVTHDFFDLGGDSILVMRMSMEVKAAFGIEVPVREIFERPTIRALAARVDELVLQQSLKSSLSFDVDAAQSNNQELIEL